LRLVDWIRKLMWRILGDPPDPPALRIGKTYLVFPALETPLSLEAGRLYYRSIGGRAVPYTQDGSQEYEVGSILSQQKIIPQSAGADALVIRSYDDSIDRLKILEDGSIITGAETVGKLDSASGVLELAKLKMTGDLDMGGYVAKNLGAPVDPNDSARKSDVDTVQSNLDTHRTSIPIDHPDGSITDEKIAEMSRTKLKPPVLEGLIADRPSAGVAGRIYIATDERKVYRDTGTAWEEITAVERLADHEAKKTDVHGVASPDEIAGKSYVDDSISAHEGKALDGIHKVLTGNEADMPQAGEAGRIYIATDTLKIFRDTGTEWKELTAVGRLNTHEGKNTGVHGAGANYLAYASVSDYIADTELSNHEGKSTGVHGVGSSYICKTSRSDQLPSWGDIPDKPSQFPPEPHASSHKQGGADEIVGVVLQGLDADKPTAGVKGRFWLSTDTKALYFDDGTNWILVGVLGGLDLTAHASRHDIGGADEIPGLASHASRHKAGGADQLFDQNLNTTDAPKFAGLTLAGDLLPDSDKACSIGSSSRRLANVFSVRTYVGDGNRGIAYSKFAGFATCNINAIFDRAVWTEYFGNFLLYADLKPGAVLSTSGSISNPENVFRPGDSYATLDTSGGSCVIELTGISIPVTSSVSSNRAFVQFHGGGGSVYLKIEVQGKSGTWYTVFEDTVDIGTGRLVISDPLTSKGVVYPDEWPATGIRVTFSNSTSNPFWVRQVGVLGGRNPLEAMPYLPLCGGSLYGSLRPSSTNTYDLGSSSYKWRNVYLHHLNFANQIRDDYIKLWDYYLIGIRSYTWFAQSDQRFQFKSREANNSDYPEIFQLLRSDESVAFGVRYDGAITTFGGFGTHVLPISDNAYDLGSSSYRWANVYGVNIYASAKVRVGDLEFENKWKFTEHPKYGIVLVSPKGKKYRLVLEEIAE